MLRPVPMTRALIVGPRDNLEATVENLYNLKLVHIVDHREGEEGLEIGRPLPTASEASEILVKLRSIASALQLEETKPASTEEVAGDLREKILSLELNISEEDAARKKTQALLQDLDRKTDEVRPFAQLRLSLADYRGYETVEVFVGKVAGEIEGLDSVTPDYEAFTAPGLLAVFVPKPQAAAVREFLTQRGFTTIPVPEGEGDPREILSDLLAERERWQARLEEVEKRLDALRERYAGFLSAARARLEVTVEKAEAPLRFAVTDHTFIVEGWVPTESFEKLEGGLGRFQGLYVTELEHDHAPEHAEEHVGDRSARLAPQREASATIRDARDPILHSELPRGRSDVHLNVHIPNFLRSNGRRRGLRDCVACGRIVAGEDLQKATGKATLPGHYRLRTLS